MTDHTNQPPVGLADAIEEARTAFDLPLTPESAPAIVARSARAQAVAACEHARATSLQATLSALMMHEEIGLGLDEVAMLRRRARVLAGLPDGGPASVPPAS